VGWNTALPMHQLDTYHQPGSNFQISDYLMMMQVEATMSKAIKLTSQKTGKSDGYWCCGDRWEQMANGSDPRKVINALIKSHPPDREPHATHIRGNFTISRACGSYGVTSKASRSCGVRPHRTHLSESGSTEFDIESFVIEDLLVNILVLYGSTFAMS
jgi:hypothetical protein